MRKELTFSELDDERVELLPARDTLTFFTPSKANWANVMASNNSYAINAASFHSLASSNAWQAINVTQS
jgi:uncharacterized alpha-E superfamily protein